MAGSIRDLLAQSPVLDQVVLTTEVDQLLSALEVTGPTQDLGGGITTGAVSLVHDLSQYPIPGFDFALTLPEPGLTVPFKLKLDPAVSPSSFRFWLQLADEQHALAAFTFVKGVPEFALTGATKVVDSDGTVSLQAIPATDPASKPRLVSRAAEAGTALGPALLVTGSAGATATVRFTPDTDSVDGVIALGLEPSAVVFGRTTMGFECPALIIDDSQTAAAPGTGAPGLDPPIAALEADQPSWRGIIARQLSFYLPKDVPLFGGQPIEGYLAIPRGSGGVELVVATNVPPREQPSRPGFSIRIECRDPTANGLSALVPTLISASMELPLDGAQAGFTQDGGPGQTITFGAGRPVRATLALARDPVNARGVFSVTVGVSGQGNDGLLSVKSGSSPGAKIFDTAAALATALIADKNIARAAIVGDTDGVVLAAVLAAGGALSSLFTNDGGFVLHGVEIESSGHGAPIGDSLVFTIDYSVAVVVEGINVGVASVSMDSDQPMRIRVRKARMSIDFTKSGLSMIGLDFDQASTEVEDPGGWNVDDLKSLFDVLRSRSGRGSTWIEVDLGFKLNLGPVKVSGATIRATLQPNGQVQASIRGLAAEIDVPGAIKGSGALQSLSKPDGFEAALAVSLIPLNLNVDASVVYAPPLVLLNLKVDLPAPVPLANSGLGLLGVAGLLGFSARPDYEGTYYEGTHLTDPVAQQLAWTPDGADSFRAAAGQSSFGLAAAIGTLPDVGFTFSAKAGILITVPDIAIRGALNGQILQPPVKMSDPSWKPPAGLSFLGFIGVDGSALSFELLGRAALKPLMEVSVPVAGHFPFSDDTSDWYVYLGADGSPDQGRAIGPISAKILPDLIGAEADAYFMARGHGLTNWPNGHRLMSINDGFVAAFGFSLQTLFGLKPVLWAELHARLDLLVGSKPPTLAGFGQAGGSLHLGPFSVGVQAQVKFIVAESVTYFWAEVTGRIDFFIGHISATIPISFGNKIPNLTLPAPDRHPLDRLNRDGTPSGSLGVLTDDRYTTVAALTDDPAQARTATAWPDIIVSLPFAVAPDINPALADGQFPGAAGPGAPPAPTPLGTEMLHYNWRLDAITLRDVTTEPDKVNGPGVQPAGQLAARWQLPRTGPGGSDVSELLLFSTGPDLWVNRLADAGAKLPGGDPLGQAANACSASVPDPPPGWAVGFLATTTAQGFRLPPDPVSADPRVCRVEALLHHAALALGSGGQPAAFAATSLDTIGALPEPYTIEPATLIAWPQTLDIGRTFDGHLLAPNLRFLPGQAPTEAIPGRYVGQQITLDLAEPIVGGELVIVTDRSPGGVGSQGVVTDVTVSDDSGTLWTNVQPIPIPTGDVAFAYRAPAGQQVSRLTVTFPLGIPVGVIGVAGVTVSSAAAATLERGLVKAEADRRAAATGLPAPGPGPYTPHQRAILDPGRVYRIDVAMTWSGTISRQDEHGQITQAAHVNFGDLASTTYGSDGRPATKHLFFQTAQEGAPARAIDPMRSEAFFRPEMLVRYLGGYEPAQGEQAWFCDDPLRAHFLQDHVAALALAYGYQLVVTVRRVDRPGVQHATPETFPPTWSYCTNPAFLTIADQIRYAYAAASSCPGPRPGATATVDAGLEPQALYELYVQAQPGDAELPGVTFTTSRWHRPDDMFTGLGCTALGQAPASVIIGDLAITLPGSSEPDSLLDDDQALDQALVSLGITDWPPADGPRLSLLWATDTTGGWLFGGLLIESPEPVHRPGRLEVTGLQGQTDTGLTVTFGFSRRDRIGARLLYVARNPVQVAPAGEVSDVGPPDTSQADHGDQPVLVRPPTGGLVPTVTLNATSITSGAASSLTASIGLPQQPYFAGDPS